MRLVTKFDISTVLSVIGNFYYENGEYNKRKEIEESAELNNPFAQHILGKMNQFGNGMPINYEVITKNLLRKIVILL